MTEPSQSHLRGLGLHRPNMIRARYPLSAFKKWVLLQAVLSISRKNPAEQTENQREEKATPGTDSSHPLSTVSPRLALSLEGRPQLMSSSLSPQFSLTGDTGNAPRSGFYHTASLQSEHAVVSCPFWSDWPVSFQNFEWLAVCVSFRSETNQEEPSIATDPASTPGNHREGTVSPLGRTASQKLPSPSPKVGLHSPLQGRKNGRIFFFFNK